MHVEDRSASGGWLHSPSRGVDPVESQRSRGHPGWRLRSRKDQRIASACRCIKSELPTGGNFSKPSRMFRICARVTPPDEGGGIE